MIRLSSLRDAFEGVIPSVIATTDGEGVPNASYLSHVHYIDDHHVALSNQFFSKTARNVGANGLATVMVVDGRSGAQYPRPGLCTFSDRGRNLRAHQRASGRNQQRAGFCGDHEAARRRYLPVEDCRAVPTAHPLELLSPEAEDQRDHLELARRLAERLASQLDTEGLLDAALEGLEGLFGYTHSMVLVPDEERMQLSTIASRGYDRFGIGSEVAFGSGIIGMAATTRRAIRISDLRRVRRYVKAIGSASGIANADPLPLPALEAPISQLAVPMVALGRLVGILFVESELPFAFRHRDEEALGIVATHLALAMALNAQERERPEPQPPARPSADALKRMRADRCGCASIRGMARSSSTTTI